MLTILFWIGVILTVLGVGFILKMGLDARKITEMKPEARRSYGQKLILINFLGVGLSVFGIMFILLSILMS